MIERLVKKYAYTKNCPFAKQILDDEKKMDFLRKSWPRYKGCAEVDLKCSFMDFYAEMSTFLYLARESSYDIKSFRVSDSGFQRNEGPDLYVENKRLWVECISPSKVTSYDRALRIFESGVRGLDIDLDLIDEKFYKKNGLRFLNPLLSKYKKYKKYIDNGVVFANDTKIISISLQKINSNLCLKLLGGEMERLLSLLNLADIDGVLIVAGDVSSDEYLYVKNSNLKRVH